MKAMVFVGPTLRVEEARGLLDADFRPPVRQGDIVTAVMSARPSAIAIIDGVFFQDLAVWHKEILYALSVGVPVFGASSMGALRAAELHEYGMIGVGAVFAQYRDGQLTSDDEVVLAHGAEAENYIPLSMPLVNIRATLQSAYGAGSISRELYEDVLRIAGSLYFPERTVTAICAAVASRWACCEVGKIAHILQVEYRDVKKEDAVQMLRMLSEWKHEPRQATPHLERSGHFEMLMNADRQVNVKGKMLPIVALFRAAAVDMSEFEHLRAHGLNEAITILFGGLLGISASTREVLEEEQILRRHLRITERAAFEQWCSSSNTSEEEFRDVARDAANARKVREWWLSLAWSQSEQIRVVLNQFKLCGRYQHLVEAVAERERVVPSTNWGASGSVNREMLMDAILEQMRIRQFDPGIPVAKWAHEVGFLDLADLYGELDSWRRARAAGCRQPHNP